MSRWSSRLPDTGGRYYAMPMYDAWTTVFGTLGTRTTGTRPLDVVLVPPGRRSQLPRELHVVQAPTAHAWILGHIRSDGARDHAGVRGLQEQIRLTPLSRWPGPGAEDQVSASPRPLDAASPAAQVARMDPREYFTRVARLLAVDPAHGTDRGRLHRLEALGVAAGRPPAWSLDDRPLVREIARGMDEGLAQVEAAARRLSSGDRAWTSPADLLRRQSEPLQRAALAWTGLGAWPRADGLFYTTQVDASGAALTGERPHVLRFAPGSEPPARAFWSLTVHDGDGLAGEHRCRLAVGDRDPLWRAPDGSLTIHLSADPPRSDAANWLPTPPGPFGLALRLYWPGPTALDGSWWPPGVDLAGEASGRAVVPPAAAG